MAPWTIGRTPLSGREAACRELPRLMATRKCLRRRSTHRAGWQFRFTMTWRNGSTPTLIGKLPGDHWAWATGINAGGTVVGTSYYNDGVMYYESTAFVWT